MHTYLLNAIPSYGKSLSQASLSQRHAMGSHPLVKLMMHMPLPPVNRSIFQQEPRSMMCHANAH